MRSKTSLQEKNYGHSSNNKMHKINLKLTTKHQKVYIYGPNHLKFQHFVSLAKYILDKEERLI